MVVNHLLAGKLVSRSVQGLTADKFNRLSAINL
jgi:hypothetical protein